jgi:hypothetical protein
MYRFDIENLGAGGDWVITRTRAAAKHPIRKIVLCVRLVAESCAQGKADDVPQSQSILSGG